MHQSNLTGDRLGYPMMDGVLSAYRAVYAGSAPILNLPLSGDGAALHAQHVWAQALSGGTVTGYVQGNTVTITGPPGTPVPVTVPTGTRVGTAGAAFGTAYAGEHSDRTTLGSGPLTLVLGTTPYPAGQGTAAPTAAHSPLTRSTRAINARVNPSVVPAARSAPRS